MTPHIWLVLSTTDSTQPFPSMHEGRVAGTSEEAKQGTKPRASGAGRYSVNADATRVSGWPGRQTSPWPWMCCSPVGQIAIATLSTSRAPWIHQPRPLLCPSYYRLRCHRNPPCAAATSCIIQPRMRQELRMRREGGQRRNMREGEW